MTQAYEICEYRIESLKRIICDHPAIDDAAVERKLHMRYFDNYFAALKAKTILIEKQYIDKGYLDDFSAYYVRRFANYEKNCRRLHFFACSFNTAEFGEMLSTPLRSTEIDRLKRFYLGFIVLKPLPATPFGRTCLTVYPNGLERFYPIVHTYRVNLFGIELKVETLPFQEQDATVAACATSALWTAFQGTALLFQHRIPSFFEITDAAVKRVPLMTSQYLEKGLNTDQMADAIRNIGLLPSYRANLPEQMLKMTLYAYLKSRIPIIMLLHLVCIAQPKPKLLSGHAVTVTGYRIHRNPASTSGNEPLLKAGRLTKIYAHDDQIGPFAKMEFENPQPWWHQDYHQHPGPWLSTSYLLNDQEGYVKALPVALLIPVYPKIVVPFHSILEIVTILDRQLEEFRKAQIFSIQNQLEWDIYLTDLNTFKSSLLGSSNLDSADLHEILCKRMPRFIWRAIAYDNAKPVFELVFDATDILQGKIFITSLEYDKTVAMELPYIAQGLLTANPNLGARHIGVVLNWFRKKI